VLTIVFQSPIGTNKTKDAIDYLYSFEEFQSPIGTNKTS